MGPLYKCLYEFPLAVLTEYKGGVCSRGDTLIVGEMSKQRKELACILDAGETEPANQDSTHVILPPEHKEDHLES